MIIRILHLFLDISINIIIDRHYGGEHATSSFSPINVLSVKVFPIWLISDKRNRGC